MSAVQFRRLVRDLLPPLLVRALRRPRGVQFSRRFASWQQAVAASSGYDQPAILEKVEAAALKVRRGEAVYERDSVLFDHIEYSWPVLAALMWVAARRGGRLNVLDFGGSLGTAYFQNRKFLADLDVRWSIVEQGQFVSVGREKFADGRLGFFESVTEVERAHPVDALFFGGSLQFLPDPYAVMEQVAAVPRDLLVIDRTPFTAHDEDMVFVQVVPPDIYPASYPSHLFSSAKFQGWMRSRGWKLVEEFMALEGRGRTACGVEYEFKGMLFAR